MAHGVRNPVARRPSRRAGGAAGRRDAGTSVAKVAGVEEALALLRLHDFDAVLSDVHMRDRSGFEILGELNARGKRTRVVLMTSFASPDVVESARAAGAAGVLSKPFGEDQLLEVLEQKS